jgi:hypothetical protein
LNFGNPLYRFITEIIAVREKKCMLNAVFRSCLIPTILLDKPPATSAQKSPEEFLKRPNVTCTMPSAPLRDILLIESDRNAFFRINQ